MMCDMHVLNVALKQVKNKSGVKFSNTRIIFSPEHCILSAYNHTLPFNLFCLS